MFICRFCNINYSRKDSLIRHLKSNSCSVAKTMTHLDFHNKIEELEKIAIVGNNNTINNNNVWNINVAINIQPISKLSLDHITEDKMEKMVHDFDMSPKKFDYLLTNYLNIVLYCVIKIILKIIQLNMLKNIHLYLILL